jgi:hypothetical protein
MDVPKLIVHVKVVTRIEESPVRANPTAAVPTVIIRTTAAPVPISIQPRSDSETGTEDGHARRVGEISPQNLRIVLRNINHLRLSRFDLNVIGFDGDLLLGSVLKHSGLGCLCPQTLDRPFDVCPLHDVGLPKRGSPIGVVCHHPQDDRIMSDGLDAHIPVLPLNQVFVHPALKQSLSL